VREIKKNEFTHTKPPFHSRMYMRSFCPNVLARRAFAWRRCAICDADVNAVGVPSGCLGVRATTCVLTKNVSPPRPRMINTMSDAMARKPISKKNSCVQKKGEVETGCDVSFFFSYSAMQNYFVLHFGAGATRFVLLLFFQSLVNSTQRINSR
jgi:hypothetical protein